MENTTTKAGLTEELSNWDHNYYLHPTSVPGQRPKMIFDNGEGIYVKNTDGETYIDGISMLWNVNLGHGQEELAAAAAAQMKKMAFGSSFVGYTNEPAIRLAKELSEWAPEELNCTFYTSGGSESNDTAFKLARFYWNLKDKPEKKKFISFKNGYHGVTIGAGTATTVPGFHRFAGVQLPEILHADAHLTECEKGDRNHPDYKNSVRHLLETEGADTIAGIIIEPIQGSGGVYIPPNDYLQALRELCDEFDVLLIADEVINGFYRTGTKFAVEHWGVVPDLLTMAKGITSGYAQLGAVMLHDKVKEIINTTDQIMAHGFTYSGHPMACAVALKNMEIMERENLGDHVTQMEKVMNEGIEHLKDKHSIVGNIRNKGLIGAFELLEDRDTNKQFAKESQVGLRFVEECFQNKLILRALRASEGKNIVAVAPPLVIKRAEIEKMISIMDSVLTQFKA